jgi:hypothetical protein
MKDPSKTVARAVLVLIALGALIGVIVQLLRHPH